jgi:hypothetical protein
MAWPSRCQERHVAMNVSEAVAVTPGRTTTPVSRVPEKEGEVPVTLYSPAGTASRKRPFRSVSTLPTTTLPLALVIVILPTIGLSGGSPPPTRAGPPVESIRPAIVPVETVRAIVLVGAALLGIVVWLVERLGEELHAARSAKRAARESDLARLRRCLGLPSSIHTDCPISPRLG